MRTIFLGALKQRRRNVLCGILATEAHSLPPPVEMLREPIYRLQRLVSRAFGQAGVAEPKRRALETTALFQGAMLQAVSLGDVGAFGKA